MLCRTFFGEEDFFERTPIRGVLTMLEYAWPRYDTQGAIDRPAYREEWDTTKMSQAMRWALSGLSRLPLEKTYYKEVFDCIDKLGGPMKDEAKEVDALLDPGAFVAVPLYVAMGWLDPQAPTATWEEMPPSMIFEGEGAGLYEVRLGQEHDGHLLRLGPGGHFLPFAAQPFPGVQGGRDGRRPAACVRPRRARGDVRQLSAGGRGRAVRGLPAGGRRVRSAVRAAGD